MNLAKTLSLNLLKMFLLTAITAVVALRVLYANSIGSGLEAQQGITILITAMVIWLLLLSRSALTMLLNLSAAIRDRFLPSLLSFFLLPVVISLMLGYTYPAARNRLPSGYRPCCFS